MTSPASATVLVFLDPDYEYGRIADPAQPQLMATDQGATRGDGVFESMLAIAGRTRKVQAHLDRLGGSALALDLEIPGQDVWRRAIETGVSAFRSDNPASSPDEDEAVVKLVVTRGVEGASSPTCWVQVSAVGAAGRRQREAGVDVILLDRGYDSDVAERAPWLLLGAKTLSYAVNMAALRHAARQGAGDVIFVSTDGYILEGPRSTVVIATESENGAGTFALLTPPPWYPILRGTTQQALFEVARNKGYDCDYRSLRPADLVAAQGVWLISSITLAARVHTLDGKVLRHAPLAEELAELVDAAIVSDR